MEDKVPDLTTLFSEFKLAHNGNSQFSETGLAYGV